MAPLPLACSLTTPELRARREQLLELLRQRRPERSPLPNGYRLRFDGGGDIVSLLAPIIEAERECCPFLQMRLTVEPGHGSVWLELTGPRGTRAFLEQELGLAAR